MSGATRTAAELPEATKSPYPIRHIGSEPADLLQTCPLVINPAFPSCQIELSIHPQQNVHIHDLEFEVNLNTFKIGRDEADNLIFPYHGFQSIGERAPGFHLAIDNSPSARPDLGPSVRICWTVDFADIPTSIAAVVFSLSVSSVQVLRTLVVHLHSAVREKTGYTRRDFVGEMRIPVQMIQAQSQGHKGGTVVLAALARSDAWWHMHGMLSFSPPITGVSFAERICQQPPKGAPAPLWPLLRSVNERSPLGYTDLRNISVTAAAARHLPQPSVFERLTCGLATTHAHATLQLEDPAPLAMQRPIVGPMRRVSRQGTVDWASDADRAEGRLTVERVSAADARTLRIVLPSGSTSTLRGLYNARFTAAGVAEGSAGADGGVAESLPPQPVLDVPLARLWGVMPRGNRIAQRRLQVQLRRPPGEKHGGRAITVVLHVDVTQCPWPM